MLGNESQGSAVSQRRSWQIGDVTMTKIVESHAIIDLPNLMPKATVTDLLALPWLQPHFLTPEGRAIISIHALVVDTPTKRIIVDTCVGNGRDRGGDPFFSNLQTSFLQDLEVAGFARDSVDVVLCTHLHLDHVGWNTMWVDGQWIPTFPKARYLLNATEYSHWRERFESSTATGFDKVQQLAFADAVKPVFDAGLVDLVRGTHRICDEVTLVPTPGHSPGHVSVRIVSGGEEALITGDISHHPSQLAHNDWSIALDFDSAQAQATRRRVFSDAAERSILVVGTHWAGATAGKVKRNADAFWLDCDAESTRSERG